MTESLADGPDWHLRSRFCYGLSLFSTVDKGAALRLTNSIDAILEDKELMKMQVDLQKTFPDFPDISQIFGGPSVHRGDTNESFNNHTKGRCLGNTPG